MSDAPVLISVIICAYTQKRWDELVEAVDSVLNQSVPASEIIVAVDHNPALYARICAELSTVKAIQNQYAPGLSGARNSGIAAALGDVLAFMDEDAAAHPDWLAQLQRLYADPQVMGVGGRILPKWLSGRPAWFPAEFEWVVGCTYLGMPEAVGVVRNLIGCNMSFRRAVFAEVGGFRDGIGRVGTRPVGCEETELCIRLKQHWPDKQLLYQPQAKVMHRVPEVRTRWQYFCSRCWHEGLSKAQVAWLVGTQAGLASERAYTLHALPSGVARGLASGLLKHDPQGWLRASAIVAGLGLTTLGYITGVVSRSLLPGRAAGQLSSPRLGGSVS